MSLGAPIGIALGISIDGGEGIPPLVNVAMMTGVICMPNGIIGMIIGAIVGYKEEFVINKDIDLDQINSQ